jgi:ATPase subunit of ABC transporter with duplicated ATPase domains
MSVASLSVAAPHARDLAIFEHVQWQPPGAAALWSSPLNLAFANERCGLVGRNGSGKSVLCGLLAGVLNPSAGRVRRLVEVAYVPQSIDPGVHSLARVSPFAAVFDALARIEAGDADARDFSIAESNWDLPARWAEAMEEAGLPAFAPSHPAHGLSGGELERVALACAFLSGAGQLVLDEPTNHLDRAARAWLTRKLAAWRGGVVIASHDRELLDGADRIVELSSVARSYGGNHAFYAERRAIEQAATLEDVAHARALQARLRRELQAQHDDQQRRVARGNRVACEANLPRIGLGIKKDQAQRFDGRDRIRREATLEAAEVARRSAQARVEAEASIALALPASRVAPGKRVLRMARVRLARLDRLAPIELVLAGPARVAVVGSNGSGKSTLLQAIRHPASVVQGELERLVDCVLLDQDNSALLPPAASVLEMLRRMESPLAETDLRSRLALLGLGAGHCDRPAATLSGGERLKAALACALWGCSPTQLLLLDEPTNHLDLASIEALESALRDYNGALIVASHDARFLQAIGVDRRWMLSDAGLVVEM